MRINEFNNLEEFKSQYCGWWDPSEGKWLGLEFKYNNRFYRFHTGLMLDEKKPILPNGKEGKFCIYEMICEKEKYPSCDRYQLIGWYSDMDDLLERCIINGEKFEKIITEDDTEILAQD